MKRRGWQRLGHIIGIAGTSPAMTPCYPVYARAPA